MIRPQRNAFRDFLDLSGLWRIRFDPEDVGLTEDWAKGLTEGLTIAVPGSWNEQLAEAGFMNYTGVAWYETSFFVPYGFSGKALLLRFGAADYEAQVFVNGRLVGASGPHYLPFACDVSECAVPGQNLRVVVRVCATLPESGPTQRVIAADYVAEGRRKDEYFPSVRFDFFPYGGLNRPVYLCAVPRQGIDSVRATPKLLQRGGVFSIRIQTKGAVAACRAKCGDTEVEGAVVSGMASLEMELPEAPVWSPEDPALLTVNVEALDDAGNILDAVGVRTGLREVRIEGASLLLNGRPLRLRGFGKHEDSPMRGRGLDLPQLVKDFQLLRWCGANSVRTSHYPYSEEFYDLCDEQGILVIDECFSINLDFRKTDSKTLQAHKDAVSALIERDFNHPSVIAWSLANEPGYLGEACYAEASAPYWRDLFAHARQADSTRPLTHAHVDYAGDYDPAFEHVDFISINRYYGWYTMPGQLDRAAERLKAEIDRLSSAHGKPVFVSEFGADALAGTHATTPQLFTEDYQSDFIAEYWAVISAHPWAIGGHVWAFADFRTAQHARRVVFNHKGVFTRTREPKKAAYRVRSLWTDNP
jgi:beta-glucuronidase